MHFSTTIFVALAALLSLATANPVPTRPKDVESCGPTDCTPPHIDARTVMLEREAEARPCPPCSDDYCPPCSMIPYAKRNPEPARPTDIYICPSCQPDSCPPCTYIQGKRSLATEDEAPAKRNPEPARPTDIYICPSCQPESCPPCTYFQGKRDLAIEDEGLAKRMAAAKALRTEGPCNDIDCPPRPIPAGKREAALCDGDHCKPNWPIPSTEKRTAEADAMMAACPPCSGDYCPPCGGNGGHSPF